MYPIVHCSTIYCRRTWKQAGCPSTDEQIKKLWYIYTKEYYLAIKRNAFESVLMRWMNLEPNIQSEVSQKEKEKYHFLMHIYMESRKMVLKNLFTGHNGETNIGSRLMDMGRVEGRVRCLERVTWKLTLPYVK